MAHSPTDALLALQRRATGEIVEVIEHQIQMVIFSLKHGDGLWAIRGKQVREILAPTQVFFVPGCPAAIEGVINVRGDIVSVIHLGRILGLGANQEQLEGSGAILLGRDGDMTSGLRVDAVIDVVDIPESSILPPPVNLTSLLRQVVDGAFTCGGQPVALLDLARLFSYYKEIVGTVKPL